LNDGTDVAFNIERGEKGPHGPPHQAVDGHRMEHGRIEPGWAHHHNTLGGTSCPCTTTNVWTAGRNRWWS
jgi:hypothetical protein